MCTEIWSIDLIKNLNNQFEQNCEQSFEQKTWFEQKYQQSIWTEISTFNFEQRCQHKSEQKYQQSVWTKLSTVNLKKK